jgi:hypothetical protein
MWDEYGLGIQPKSPHFTMSYWLWVAQISIKIPTAWSAWAAVHGGDTSICTSTACKGCQTPFIYITLMWDEYGLGLQPKSLHLTMSYWLWVAQITSKIRTAWSAWAAITWWGHIHMHIHSIQRLSNSFHIWQRCEMNMGWVYSLNHRISPSLISWELPRFLAKFQQLGRHERP